MSIDVVLQGGTTIGTPGDVHCLESLVAGANYVAAELEIEASKLEISMGMSG